MRGISLLAEKLLAFHERLRSFQLVNYLVPNYKTVVDYELLFFDSLNDVLSKEYSVDWHMTVDRKLERMCNGTTLIYTSTIRAWGKSRKRVGKVSRQRIRIRNHKYGGPVSSVNIATGYGLGGPESNPSGDEIFRPSKPALGPTQHPVKWVPGLSRG